jgi:hypothetical protein
MTLTIGRWGEYQAIIWNGYIIVINTVSRLAFAEPLGKYPSRSFNKIIKTASDMEQPITKLQINSELESYKDYFKNIPYIVLNNNFHSLGIVYQLGNQLRLTNSNTTREIHNFIKDWNNKKHSTTKIEPNRVDNKEYLSIQAETYIRDLKQRLK